MKKWKQPLIVYRMEGFISAVFLYLNFSILQKYLIHIETSKWGRKLKRKANWI